MPPALSTPGRSQYAPVFGKNTGDPQYGGGCARAQGGSAIPSLRAIRLRAIGPRAKGGLLLEFPALQIVGLHGIAVEVLRERRLGRLAGARALAPGNGACQRGQKYPGNEPGELSGPHGGDRGTGVRRLLYLLSLITGSALLLSSAAGCAMFKPHPHKIRSYDQSITNEDRDPTYHDDPERADLEVHQDQ